MFLFCVTKEVGITLCDNSGRLWRSGSVQTTCFVSRGWRRDNGQVEGKQTRKNGKKKTQTNTRGDGNNNTSGLSHATPVLMKTCST